MINKNKKKINQVRKKLKKTEVTTTKKNNKKIDHQKNIASLPTEKINKNIYILSGDSIAVVFRFFCQYSLVPPVFRCSTSVPLFRRCSVFRSSGLLVLQYAQNQLLTLIKTLNQTVEQLVYLSLYLAMTTSTSKRQRSTRKICDKEIAFYESQQHQRKNSFE